MNTNNDKQQAKLLQGADFRPKKVPFFFIGSLQIYKFPIWNLVHFWYTPKLAHSETTDSNLLQ